MATLLSAAFRSTAANSKDYSQNKEMTYSVSYPTGFLNLDFKNGYIQDLSDGRQIYQLGIADGSTNMLVSGSSVGKTTLATQIAFNIIRPFPTACVFIEQIEKGSNLDRVEDLSKCVDAEEFHDRCIIRDIATTESLYNRIKMIHDEKCGHPNDYMYDTGLVDKRGNKIFKYEPTVVIVDSIPMLFPQKAAESDDVTNMAGAQNANANKMWFGKMTPLQIEANIITILINHISVAVNTGFLPQKSELPWLKQGEHLPGGRFLAYICNNIIRLDIISKLKSEDTFGIDGSVVSVDLVKSRNNKSGRSMCQLVFDLSVGYDEELSLFKMLKDAKILEGTSRLTVPGCDTKVTQKGFKETLHTNEEFRNAFVSACVTYLTSELIVEHERIKAEITASNSPTSAHEMMLTKIRNLQLR